jgi:hypothetical protein
MRIRGAPATLVGNRKEVDMTQQVTGAAEATSKLDQATVGEAFAHALAAKDRDRLVALLSDEVDFEALTPRRHWVAATSTEAVDEVMLRHWLGPDDVVFEVRAVTSGQVADRQRVGYRLAVRRDGRDHVLEQQAYYVADGQRISWIRILCSGYRPAENELIQIPGDDRDEQKEFHHA